ncbi:hypothetical protein TRVL_05550 [Trypanosoma vivax]|nr:hypothetical protein TRVL_05550 [Trypanosoma vivax]
MRVHKTLLSKKVIPRPSVLPFHNRVCLRACFSCLLGFTVLNSFPSTFSISTRSRHFSFPRAFRAFIFTGASHLVFPFRKRVCHKFLRQTASKSAFRTLRPISAPWPLIHGVGCLRDR